MSGEAQRAELHKTIWRIANDLRGAVDGWDFKSYVLGMLFYRFISENLTDYINRHQREAGQADFNFAKLSDAVAENARATTVQAKGFYILPSELFENVRERARHDENLNVTLSQIFKDIEGSAVGTASESDLKGLFDDLDVNSPKLGNTVAQRNDKIVKLLDAIGDLNIGSYADNSIDAFGDAYEYLMAMYASSAGKSGGEYFTPQEVSNLLTRIAVQGKTKVNKVYDPACGSGSLLLQFAKVLGKENVRQGFYGQEINLTTYNLCRINMFLHDINYENFNIALGDTLTHPSPEHADEEPFEAIVSNPPYSTKWEGDANPLLIQDPRFAPAGVLAPKTKADLAFTMHMLSWLAVDGTAVVIEFPGVLYRGQAEAKIRKYLVDNNFVDAIIQLPDNMFYGTSIATCALVLKKSKRDNSVLFIDASAEFEKVGKYNVMTEPKRQRILDLLEARESVEYVARLVDAAEIAENDYTLSVSTYVEKEDTREVIDITALNAEIAEIVARQQVLREKIDAIVADLEGR
ncbi:MAG TPA: type I restriction-modification system subunit M [Microbacteriaceae bacterium]|nr:type I restriction-modification system subunit M [Microbacteriaceae bacterium]